MKKNNILKYVLILSIPVSIMSYNLFQNFEINKMETEISNVELPKKEEEIKILSNNDIKKKTNIFKDKIDEFLRTGTFKNEKEKNVLINLFGLYGYDDNNLSSKELKKYLKNIKFEILDSYGMYSNNDDETTMIMKVKIKQGNNELKMISPYIQIVIDNSSDNIIDGEFYENQDNN